MIKTQKRSFFLCALFAAFFASTVWARAQETVVPECPANATKNLYTLIHQFKTNRTKDYGKAFKFAYHASHLCAQNQIILGQAAELFYIAGSGIKNNDDQFKAYSSAYQMILENGKFVRDGQNATVTMTAADGTVFEYQNTAQVDKILPYVLNSLNRLTVWDTKIHPIFDKDDSPAQFFEWENTYWDRGKCPHPAKRAETEARRFWEWSKDRKNDNNDISLNRIQYLMDLCEFPSNEPAKYLAFLYRDHAKRVMSTTSRHKWKAAKADIDKAFMYLEQYVGDRDLDTMGENDVFFLAMDLQRKSNEYAEVLAKRK